MESYSDGSYVKTRRNGAGYAVDYFKADGTLIQTFECDNLAEMAAAVHYGPSRW
jgi:hypothetical protein